MTPRTRSHNCAQESSNVSPGLVAPCHQTLWRYIILGPVRNALAQRRPWPVTVMFEEWYCLIRINPHGVP